jgi:hypothetical protein
MQDDAAGKGPKPLAKRRNLNARRLTSQQLDRAASISPTDIAHAKAAWRTDAPYRYRSLLDAQEA